MRIAFTNICTAIAANNKPAIRATNVTPACLITFKIKVDAISAAAMAI